MTIAFVAPADELQIRNLIARYAYAVDGGEKEAFASLFLEDGAWTRETSPPATQGGSGLPSQTIRGRTGLMGLIETAIIGRFQLKARHQMTDVLVEPGADENSAKARFRALVTDWREGPAACPCASSTQRRTSAPTTVGASSSARPSPDS